MLLKIEHLTDPKMMHIKKKYYKKLLNFFEIFVNNLQNII